MGGVVQGRLTALGHGYRQPVETLVEALAGGGAAWLDEPLAATHGGEAELLGDLCRVLGLGQILLVGEDQKDSLAELVLGEHLLKLLASVLETSRVVGVDDEDEALGVLVVCTKRKGQEEGRQGINTYVSGQCRKRRDKRAPQRRRAPGNEAIR